MKKLLTSDVYQVRSSYMLDLTGYKTVLQLYQPLIGMEATALYLTLNSELDQMTLTKSPSLISRLCKLSGFSLNSLQESFDKLEAVGLVCSYVKQTNDNRYLFDLKMPLSPQEFINHQILDRLLKDRLKDEYEKTIAIFQTYNVNLNDYQEMTASFTDVFEIHHHEKNILKEKKYKQKIQNSIENSYDLTLFYQGIENLQLSKKMFDQEDEKIIQQLGILYHINALDMQNLVKQSMIENHLNSRLLAQNCRNYYDLKMPEKFTEVFHKQSPLLQSEKQGESSLQKHIYYLENISPYDLLKDKTGGKEPLKRDLQVVESVLTTLQLEPGVVNVLIETTLQKCNQSLPKNFIEALGSQWKRKKIKTVQEAIEEGKAYLKYQNQQHHDWDDFTKDIQIVSQEKSTADNIDEDALAMLEKYDEEEKKCKVYKIYIYLMMIKIFKNKKKKVSMNL